MASMGWTIDHPGVLTRTVQDAALVFDVLAGHDPMDPASSTRTAPDLRTACGADISGTPDSAATAQQAQRSRRSSRAERLDDVHFHRSIHPFRAHTARADSVRVRKEDPVTLPPLRLVARSQTPRAMGQEKRGPWTPRRILAAS